MTSTSQKSARIVWRNTSDHHLALDVVHGPARTGIDRRATAHRATIRRTIATALPPNVPGPVERGVIFEFDAFRFDPTAGELWQQGRPVRLRRQAAALLGDLVAHRARWVTRTEIETRVWRGMRVSASSHSTLLAEVRRAVGDDGRHQRVIRTCRRRGHRFVAPVRVRDAPEDDPGRLRVCDASAPFDATRVRGVEAAAHGGRIDELAGALAPEHHRSLAPAVATRQLEIATRQAERSLERARHDGPRHLDVYGRDADAFARGWARVAADRGWELHRGRRTDAACPALWPWWQVAVSIRDAGSGPHDAAGTAEWARIVREIEWLAGRSDHAGPADERQRRFALLDGLSRALHRRASLRPHVVLLEGGDARDLDTARLLAFVLAPRAHAPLWLVTGSSVPAALPHTTPTPTRSDVIALAAGAAECPHDS